MKTTDMKHILDVNSSTLYTSVMCLGLICTFETYYHVPFQFSQSILHSNHSGKLISCVFSRVYEYALPWYFLH